MRDAIRERLLEEISALKEVWQPNMPDIESEKPYAILKMGDELQGNITHGFDRFIEVWLYIDRTDYNDLDTLVAETIAALTTAELYTSNGLLFGLECKRVSADGFFDPAFNGLTKTVTFEQSFIRK